MICAALLVGLLHPCGAALGQTWAQKLGFPPDERVVIVEAVEMGLCYESNAVAENQLGGGVLTTVSAMVPCPWFGEFADWCREHAADHVGLLLTLNSEWPRYRWGAVADRSIVPGLVDQMGFLWRSPVQTEINAHADEVFREIHAQLDRAIALGIQPSHLSTHLGTLFSREDFADIYLHTAQKYWIPAVVVEITPEHVERFHAAGLPLSERMIQLIRDYPLPKLDEFHLVPTTDSYEAKREQLIELVRGLKPGLTQIVLQPSIESDALRRIIPSWQQRVWEARLLADPQIRELFAEDGVTLTHWREVMERFEMEGATTDATVE